MAFTTHLAASDTVAWSVVDDDGTAQSSGQFWVDGGAAVEQIACQSTRAGYFALSARLLIADAGLPELGSRPAGLMSFGVLPNLVPLLGAPTFAHLEDHRFGMQGTTAVHGFDFLQPLYGQLNATWVNFPRDWATVEPTASTQPTLQEYEGSSQTWITDGLIRYLTLNGVPAWQNPMNVLSDGGLRADGGATSDYPPISWSDYSAYIGAMAAAQTNVLPLFPAQTHNYYQVTWEPDISWKGTTADFLKLYQETYAAIHANDPNAVVLGPT